MKLFRKQFVVLALVTLICFLALTIILSVSVSNYMVKERSTLLLETGHTISSSVAGPVGTTQHKVMISLISNVVGSAINSRIFILDTSGNIVICNCGDYIHKGNCQHLQLNVGAEVVGQITQGDYFEIGTMSGFFLDKNCVASVPILNADESHGGYVIVSSPTSDLNGFTQNMQRIFLMSTIFPIAILLFASYYVNYRVTYPLKLISSAAKSISKGDFSKRIPVDSDDEIGELAISFNHMTNSLAQLESMRRSFVANVSHELKTPMTTIGGFIDGILDGTIKEEQQEYYLDIVSSEIKRLSRLVGSMLSLSKLESGEMKMNKSVFNFTEVIYTSVLSLEQRIEAKEIDIRGLEDLPELKILGDRDLLHQVVYNLCDNAVKFTDSGGYIEFSASENEKNSIKFSIKNSGSGIETIDLPHVFERFYKTDRSRSADKTGTGLGLFIVKTIIDIHAGSVTVSSQPCEFTEFTIILPTNNVV